MKADQLPLLINVEQNINSLEIVEVDQQSVMSSVYETSENGSRIRKFKPFHCKIGACQGRHRPNQSQTVKRHMKVSHELEEEKDFEYVFCTDDMSCESCRRDPNPESKKRLNTQKHKADYKSKYRFFHYENSLYIHFSPFSIHHHFSPF